MEIERCLPEGDDWIIRVRFKGQLLRVKIARENIDDLVDGENVDEVTVLDALREKKGKFEKDVEAAVMGSGFRSADFSSLQIVRE